MRYRIPLVFWVYNNDAGSDATPGDDDIQITVDSVNAIHRRNNTGFRYYIPCNGIRRINDDQYVNIRGYETIDPIFMRGTGSNFVKGAINIHVARNNIGMYNPVSDAIFVQRRDVTEARARTTVSHEIGHAMGLFFHTHQFSSFFNGPGLSNSINLKTWIEPVDHSRTRYSILRLRRVRICSVTGDGLCDTPADPRLDGDPGGNYVETLPPPCGPYFGDDIDAWGDRYDSPPSGSLPPDPANIMSYGRGCRTTFTRDQVAVMVHRVERGAYRHFKNGYKSPNVVIDTFEPNNNGQQARNIPLNNPEALSFHQSYRRTGIGTNYALGNNEYDACDIDWFWFQSVGGNIRIETSAIAGETNADTELRLYNATGSPGAVGSLITTNNNGGSGNFSRIDRSLPAGNSYFVEVVNRSPNVTGYYTLEVSPCPTSLNPSVSGSTTVCSPTVFTVNNTNGFPVNWQVTGSLSIVSGQNTNQVTVNATGNGSGRVEAVVGTGTCVVTRGRNVTTFTGTPAVPAGINGPSQINIDDVYDFSVVNPVNGITYEWTVTGGSIVGSSQGTLIAVDPNCGTDSQLRVRVRAFNGCNRSSYIDRFVALNCGSGGNSNFTIYPNPTNQYFDVAYTEDNQPALNSRILSSNDAGELKNEIKLELYNPQNAKLKTVKNKKKINRFAVDHLTPGIYVLHIHYQGEVYQEKVAIKTE